MTTSVDIPKKEQAGRAEVETKPQAATGRSLAAGGLLLTVATLATAGGNFALNLFLGRWFEPAEFADANFIITLMLLITALAASLQLLAAKMTAVLRGRGETGEAAALAGWLNRTALGMGVVLSVGFVFGAPVLRQFFRFDSAMPFVVLGLGMPFYLLQSVGRGVLQGQLRFGGLATTFLVEMAARLVLAAILVVAGFGVTGATIGVTFSFVVTWGHVVYLTRCSLVGGKLSTELLREVKTNVSLVSALLVAQIITNNGDVVVAKRVLDPETAGVYSAVALAGRAVYFLTWSVAATVFPASAQRHQGGQGTGWLLGGAVGVIVGLGVVCTTGAWLFGDVVLATVFGSEYVDLGAPLTIYAAATSLFAVANLIATVRLAVGVVLQSAVLFGGGLFQTALLLAFPATISSLVVAQLVAMGLVLAAVLVSLPKRQAVRPS